MEDFKAKAIEFNRKAEQAERDGYRVIEGKVVTACKPTEFSETICDVMDYAGSVGEQMAQQIEELLNDEERMAEIRNEAVIKVWGSEKARSDAMAVLSIFEK